MRCALLSAVRAMMEITQAIHKLRPTAQAALTPPMAEATAMYCKTGQGVPGHQQAFDGQDRSCCHG
jgi:hypothetical protein